MRIEILLFLVASVWVAHIYSDGKYWKQLLTYKKYYQMGGVIIGFFVLCWLFKKNPRATQEMIFSTNEYMKFYPLTKMSNLWPKRFFILEPNHFRNRNRPPPPPPPPLLKKVEEGRRLRRRLTNVPSQKVKKNMWLPNKDGNVVNAKNCCRQLSK